ncbi:tRNA (adenosine(37)-N6)-threonylcarbamoyltransferase complex transferase subunit TsaD [bacterium]|nr:tRNA (adenosine(37)-N6)-threonylcarbamoyltransferase complex transferase subunit TsaD [bacterium]
MIIIGIETSCDDTSIAIIKNGKVLANVTSSSTKVHEQYGGIVPELAARKHCTNIDKVFQHAIKIAKIKPNDIDYVAYTSEPGLIGSLHVGKVFAKQLAALLGVKIIQVNHLLAHIFSYFLDHDIKDLKFPFLSVVVSGGHTFIAINYSVNKYRILNSSIDDACGETLDKIGRLLKLPYPGGISIDKIYNSKKVFDLIKHSIADKEFSFSGLKTAVSNLINNLRQKKKKIDTVGIASSSLK